MVKRYIWQLTRYYYAAIPAIYRWYGLLASSLVSTGQLPRHFHMFDRFYCSIRYGEAESQPSFPIQVTGMQVLEGGSYPEGYITTRSLAASKILSYLTANSKLMYEYYSLPAFRLINTFSANVFSLFRSPGPKCFKIMFVSCLLYTSL